MSMMAAQLLGRRATVQEHRRRHHPVPLADPVDDRTSNGRAEQVAERKGGGGQPHLPEPAGVILTLSCLPRLPRLPVRLPPLQGLSSLPHKADLRSDGQESWAADLHSSRTKC